MSGGPEARRRSAFARAVLTRNLRVRPGENVTIEGWSHSLPWAVALAREARRLGAHPLVLHEDEEAYWDSIRAREDGVLGTVPPHEWAALAKTDVYIHMWGVGDKARFGRLPPARAGKLLGFNEAWYDAAHKAGLRGARLEVGRPFPSLAAAYGVRESDWMDQVVAASMVDPESLRGAGAPIARALRRGRRLRIHDDRGTDVTLGLARHAARLSTGIVTRQNMKERYGVLTNLPGGSVSVALDEAVAEGTIVANRSCYSDTGAATGGVFEFHDGRLVRHHFDTGAEVFDVGYRTGGAGRDRPGQLRIGLNPKLRNTPQLEDLEAGAILVAVGGNASLGGKNKSPFFGFVVNAGARLEVDGRPVPLPASTA